MRWQMNEIGKVGAVVASLTTEPVSYEALIGVDPMVQKIDVVVSSPVVATAITLIVQEFNGLAWVAVGSSMSVAAAGVYTWTIKPADGVVLRERLRVVVTTGAGDSMILDDIRQYRVED